MSAEFQIARLRASARELREWAEVAESVRPAGEPIELHSCDGHLELRCAEMRRLQFVFVDETS